MRTERNYVNGRFADAQSDAFIVVHNPATEAPFARVSAATAEEAIAAVEAAAVGSWNKYSHVQVCMKSFGASGKGGDLMKR